MKSHTYLFVTAFQHLFNTSMCRVLLSRKDSLNPK